MGTFWGRFFSKKGYFFSKFIFKKNIGEIIKKTSPNVPVRSGETRKNQASKHF